MKSWEWIVIAVPLLAFVAIVWVVNTYEPNHSARRLTIFAVAAVIIGLYVLVGIVLLVRFLVVDGGIIR